MLQFYVKHSKSIRYISLVLAIALGYYFGG
jgi:hypothetical protein